MDEDGDLRYPEDADEDVSMPSPDPPIGVDPRNYDPTLEPAPAAVPPEQHTSSSRSTLDDPLSNTPDSHFRLRPMEALSPSLRYGFCQRNSQLGRPEWCRRGTRRERPAVYVSYL
jgi:hypothetical protein